MSEEVKVRRSAWSDKPARGYSWPPAEPGNTLAVKYGATAELRLAPRAAELAEGLREIVPAGSDADEPTLKLLALVLARIETANAWLAERGLFRNEKGEPQPVLKALSTWENTAARLLDRLGCTPSARAQIGLDIVRAAAVRGVDLSALSQAELAQLRSLLAKAEGGDDGD